MFNNSTEQPRPFITVFAILSLLIFSLLTVSCGGGGGGSISFFNEVPGGTVASNGSKTSEESGSKISITSDQLFAGETAAMINTTAYEFIKLKVEINGVETVYQIQKGQDMELNLKTALGDKLQMQAEICDAAGNVVRTATSNPITIGLGKNEVVMYISYTAKLHHADCSVTEYSFTSLGATLPVDTTTYPVSGYVFNSWASGPSDGSYNGKNASGVFTNSIAPNTRSDLELYAHWTPAPLEDGTIPPVVSKINYYDDPASATPTRTVDYNEGAGLATLASGSASDAGSYVVTGATFAGWYTSYSVATGAGGLQVTSISTSQTGDVDLYAKWEYTVTLYNNPANTSDTTVANYVKETGYTLPAGNKPSAWGSAVASFEGWYGNPVSSYSSTSAIDSASKETGGTTVLQGTGGNKSYYAFFKCFVYEWKDISRGAIIEYYYVGKGLSLPSTVTPSTDMQTAFGSSNCTLDGWYPSFSGTVGSESIVGYIATPSLFSGTKATSVSTTDYGRKDFYAKYTINTSTIVYDAVNYSIYANSTLGFQVYTDSQLQALMELNTNPLFTFSGATIKLQADVSAGSKCFNDFKGTLDGNYKTITLGGYPITNTLSSGTIQNLKTAGTVSNASDMCCGAIAAKMTGGEITSCINTATVTVGTYSGGIVGRATGGTISKCSNEASVKNSTGAATIAGGLVGLCSGITIERCCNIGNVTSYGNCGGIAGKSSSTPISNCYVMGSVSGSSKGAIVGDFSGDGSSVRITKAYSNFGSGNSYGLSNQEPGATQGTYFTNPPSSGSWSSNLGTTYWEWSSSKNRPVLKGVGTEGGWGN